MKSPLNPKPMPMSATNLLMNKTNKLFGIRQSYGGLCLPGLLPASSQILMGWLPRVGSLTTLLYSKIEPNFEEIIELICKNPQSFYLLLSIFYNLNLSGCLLGLYYYLRFA
ncbi:hypothetical protein DSO57_1003207 [Entomophthora muscae]|uniref:Uncharacterized protein n=1 Tax=Entomophthora muscae TaxID=34485 RepID=A0ACC2RZT4_9FUNG|nr:hypothetical protein DSO57_1003207 [Entomophthora muscae]